LRDEFGEKVHAEFSVEREAESIAVFLESRGGAIKGSGSRNPEYAKALRLLVTRLGAKRAILRDATVESRVTRNFAHADRVVRLPFSFPIALEAQDPEEFRLALQRGQRAVGQGPIVRGGNITKRLRMLVDVDAASLDELGEDLAKGIADPTDVGFAAVGSSGGSRRGQGYAGDPAAIKAVELHAMAVVASRLKAGGWTVDDVSKHESFDLRCRKGSRELHAEVKGVTGSEPEVILTRGEVNHASAWNDCAIGVVLSIKLDRSVDPPVATGGKLLWLEPWDPNKSGELEGLKFSWRPE
jgi:hypothetical protein